MYSRVVALKVGVFCKTCGKGIEIDDEYVPGIQGASIYRHFYKYFPKSAKQAVVDSADRPWQKTLTCGTPGCGKTETYEADDVRLYDS